MKGENQSTTHSMHQSSSMEEENESINNYTKSPSSIFPNPFTFFTNLISLQSQIISTCIINLASPFLSLISLVSDSVRRHPKQDPDSSAPSGGTLLLGKVAVGLLAAAYVCIVLIVVMIIAAVLGVGFVRLWVEEPVSVKESLQFDYSNVHPTAVFEFGRKGYGVHVGHTLHVSLTLLMPESEYNIEVGIFQLAGEVISSGGELVARSSQPCMLRFRSWPIRLARTFIMGVPLLLGLTSETQRLQFPILKHKEGVYPRTDAIRVTLFPRAGTFYLPQFYDAEILVKSRHPFLKGLVYKWKWTLYVWSTLYIFLILVMVLVFFLRPVILPVLTTSESVGMEIVAQEPLVSNVTEEREISETLRRLQHSRKKRKAALLQRPVPDFDETDYDSTSASSITVTKGETHGNFDEGSGDSDSGFFRGFDT